MKSLILTIIVFVALNLAAGNYALAQEPPETEDREIVEGSMENAKKQMEAAKKQMEKAKKVMEAAQVQLKKGGQDEQFRILLRTPQLDKWLDPFLEGSTRQYGGGRILVIPSGEIKPQEVATIMEDMSVMSRILDKRLGHSRTGRGYYSALGYGGRGGYGGYGGFSPSHDSGVTESIYLDGYAALFLMKVNFPLAPPAKPVEEETKEDVDPIWEQTKREIYTPGDVKRGAYYSYSAVYPYAPAPAAEYDADKVEAIKTGLIKTLKHAANIRNLKANEWVILTATGGGQAGDISHGYGIVSKGCSDRHDSRDVDVHLANDDSHTQEDHKCLAKATGVFPPTVLTIRVKKSDVDAFSKDELKLEQFHKKVQILTY